MRFLLSRQAAKPPRFNNFDMVLFAPLRLCVMINGLRAISYKLRVPGYVLRVIELLSPYVNT